jgi:hypothetical protein
MASEDLGDDEVLMLFWGTGVLLACMCVYRPKSVKSDRGSETRRVWVMDLFRRRCIAGSHDSHRRHILFYHYPKMHGLHLHGPVCMTLS